MANYFAAIPVELPANTLHGLRESAPREVRLRWFEPEDLHVTVAFFGAFKPERQEAVIETLTALPRPDFRIYLDRLLLLPSPQRFSAIALGSAANDALMDYLRASHAPLMTAAAVPPDPREPLPHVTFARPDRKATHRERAQLARWIEPLAESLKPVPIHLHRLAMYGWAEDRNQRQFQILHEV